jgi:hypothetical protein
MVYKKQKKSNFLFTANLLNKLLIKLKEIKNSFISLPATAAVAVGVANNSYFFVKGFSVSAENTNLEHHKVL